MTNTPRAIEIGALAGVTAVTAWTLHSIPSWRNTFADPCLLAAIAAVATVGFLWMSFWVGPRAIPAEPVLLAVFLFGMPLVYVTRYLAAVEARGPLLWIELAGIPVFALLATLGVSRSPWFLALGIATHGVGWDLWHYHRSAYIPDWYSAGCLLIDLAIAIYVAVRIPEYRRAILISRKRRHVGAG